jgi:shikimate 5-dehydrogenase
LIHTVAFQKLGLPYSYRVVESDHVELYSEIIADEHFGGATVNRPHKVDIIPFLRRLTPHAEAMGAVDTIIASPAGPVGENTDWRAIHTCILRCRLRSNSTDKEPSVLVVGAGGVARAAVYALLQLGIKKVQIVNRSLDRATALASFLGRLDPNFNIAIVGDLNTQLGDDWISPDIVISTIPQLESVQDLTRLLPPEKVFAKSQGILLDMAYAPRLESPLNQLLRSMGNKNWDSVHETDALLEQAYEQIRLWTGKRAPRTAIRNAVAKQREALSSHSTT